MYTLYTQNTILYFLTTTKVIKKILTFFYKVKFGIIIKILISYPTYNTSSPRAMTPVASGHATIGSHPLLIPSHCVSKLQPDVPHIQSQQTPPYTLHTRKIHIGTCTCYVRNILGSWQNLDNWNYRTSIHLSQTSIENVNVLRLALSLSLLIKTNTQQDICYLICNCK